MRGTQVVVKCINKIGLSESRLCQDDYISAVELQLNDHQLDSDS